MGAESCEKGESFVATFGRKISSVKLFVHARYGARKGLCTGLVECGGVLVIPEKEATSWKEFPAAKTFRAAHIYLSQQAAASGRWSVRLDKHQDKLDYNPMTQR